MHLKHNNPSEEEHSILTSDDTMISTWSNGELIESSSMKILLHKFMMENEERVFKELTNSQNFVADSGQIYAFIRSLIREENKRYSQLLQICTAERQTTNKSDHLLKLLLTLNTNPFASNAVSQSHWQKPTENPTKVRVIHSKRQKFSVPIGSPYSLTGTLFEYLKDPE